MPRSAEMNIASGSYRRLRDRHRAEAVGGADGVSGTNDASQVFVASAGYRPGLDPEKLDWTVPVPLQNQARLVGMALAISVDDYGGAAIGRENIPQRSRCLGYCCGL